MFENLSHYCPDKDSACPYFNPDTGNCCSPSGWCENNFEEE